MFNTTAFRFWIVLTVVVALAGPFGTIQIGGFAFRLLYWSVVTFLSIVIGQWSYFAAKSFVDRQKPILNDLVMVALTTVLLTPMIWLVTAKLFALQVEPQPTLLRLASYIAVITAAICIFLRTILGIEKISYAGRKLVPDSPKPPRLMRRLPDGFDGPILRLTVRDHFVDVVSPQGTHSIRLRFGDAIDEMDTVVGYCTHRSHWVAKDAIDSVQRSNGRIHLELTNGDLVPVSRKYKFGLEDAGIL
ncbi:LytTR family DNA-binding domain-containing protein [Arenibacterium sp. CAU 1754]